MADIKNFTVVVVAKEDFAKFNELAENILFARNPTKISEIKSLRRYIFDNFKRHQTCFEQFAEFQEDVDNGLYIPKLLRRHSFW
jgi:hypothetical protein